MIDIFDNKNFVATETVGGFAYASNLNSFDDIFTETANTMATASVDVAKDIQDLVKNRVKYEKYRDLLLGELKQECAAMEESDDPTAYGTHVGLYKQVKEMVDNCMEDFVKESAVSQLLPIKMVDFPVLIKQQLKIATKDIMQTEVTPSPVIKKHIEQTYVKDPKSGKKWRYPQCFFTDDFKEIYEAGKGHKIKPIKVELPIFDYDVVKELTDGNPEYDQYTIDLKIEKVYVKDENGTDVPVVVDPAMYINLADNTWLGGRLDTTVKDGSGNDIVINDLVSGMVDMGNHTTTLSSAAGQVSAVEFSGYLSNERNHRTVQFEYKREEREWKIEDGFKVDAPYTLEELEDTKALLDMDLYKKTYNNLADILAQMEDNQVLQWLDDMYAKYDGLELDPLLWNSFVTEKPFDMDSTNITTALPCEFINKMLKFQIDRLLPGIADKAKMEDLTFVIYGNPNYISFLDAEVNWVTRPGSTSNGVKLDYGYGIMTSNNIKVQVVSTMKRNVDYDPVTGKHYGLRIIPFPLSKEVMTFKHYKYTTHILTSQNSAYHANTDQGWQAGSMTYVVGNSRYTNAHVQGIQAHMPFLNAEQYII